MVGAVAHQQDAVGLTDELVCRLRHAGVQVSDARSHHCHAQLGVVGLVQLPGGGREGGRVRPGKLSACLISLSAADRRWRWRRLTCIPAAASGRRPQPRGSGAGATAPPRRRAAPAGGSGESPPAGPAACPDRWSTRPEPGGGQAEQRGREEREEWVEQQERRAHTSW